MSGSTLLRFLRALLYVAVVATPLFYLRKGVYPYTLSKTAFFQGVVELLFFAWAALLVVEPRYRPRKTPVVLAVLVFLALFGVTSLTGIDGARSFWSTQERATGLFFFLHVYALVFVIASILPAINWKRLLSVSLGTSAFVGVLALIQLVNPNLLLQESIGDRPGATFGNPTFFAGYLLFNILIGAYLVYDRLRSGRRGRWGMGFLASGLALSTIALFNTRTRGDILGLGAAVLSLLLFFAFTRPASGEHRPGSRNLYAFLGVGICALGAMFWITRGASLWRAIPVLNRFQGISLSDSGLQPRLIAMKIAWQGFLERPFLGSGWENFNVVFNKQYDPKLLEANYQETRFDKPHNAFLEYLVAGGAPLFLAFFGIVVALLFELWKSNDRLFACAMTAALAGYLVRSFFVFDTIGPMMMFALIAGIADGMYRKDSELAAANGERERGSPSRRQSGPSPAKGIAAGIICASLVPFYAFNMTTLIATYHQYYGFQYFRVAKIPQAIASFKAAIAPWSPFRSALKRDYAIMVAETYFYNPDKVPKEEARLALRAMEEVIAEHPQDAYNHYVAVDMYNQISDIDPATYLAAAEREAKTALLLSPNRQEVYFSLAKTKTLEKDYPGALALLKHAIELNPKIPDAHFYYGLVLFADDQLEAGYRELKTALALGRTWRNANEPLVVANFFANGGHIDEAIEIYQAALKMRDDKETRIKLGIAYFFAGKRDLARENILEAIKGFDITKSKSYDDLLPILRELGIR